MRVSREKAQEAQKKQTRRTVVRTDCSSPNRHLPIGSPSTFFAFFAPFRG
jgi:hypothetical protein